MRIGISGEQQSTTKGGLSVAQWHVNYFDREIHSAQMFYIY